MVIPSVAVRVVVQRFQWGLFPVIEHSAANVSNHFAQLGIDGGDFFLFGSIRRRFGSSATGESADRSPGGQSDGRSYWTKP